MIKKISFTIFSTKRFFMNMSNFFKKSYFHQKVENDKFDHVFGIHLDIFVYFNINKEFGKQYFMIKLRCILVEYKIASIFNKTY